MLRPEVDINIDRGLQQTLNTKSLWLNVIITHSKFISGSFICLFLQIISIICPSFASLYRDDIVVPTVEIKHATHVTELAACAVLNLQVKVSGSCYFTR